MSTTPTTPYDPRLVPRPNFEGYNAQAQAIGAWWPENGVDCNKAGHTAFCALFFIIFSKISFNFGCHSIRDFLPIQQDMATYIQADMSHQARIRSITRIKVRKTDI